MNKLRAIIVPLFLIFLFGCSKEQISDNSKKNIAKLNNLLPIWAI